MSDFTSKPALETALSHRSIRKFTSDPIAPEMLNAIIAAGQASSTSSFMQPTHIIRVTDPELRKALRAVGANQHYIETSAEILVFCMDFSKHKTFVPTAETDWAEVTLVGAVDAGIMAQTMILVAESLGLGGVYIGCLRNDIVRTTEILQLPEYVVPLFGMSLGHPAQDPLLRPRLKMEYVVSENTYQPLGEQAFKEYNEIVKDYYQRRSNLDLDWENQILDTLAADVQRDVLPFLQKQGFLKK